MFAFVLMPFDKKFDDVYKLGIKDTAQKLGIIAERVDEQIFHKENILERIYSQISAADFIIADMTDRNPNVFYEVGYAHAKGKICLLLTSNADDIPFDLKHHRHIVYGSSIQNLILALEKDLLSVKSEVENKQSILTVDLARSDGLLEKTKYIATGNVDLYFDLNNKTNAPSPEIESMYFYTGSGWSFFQDGQQCPATEGDVGDYKMKHFIRPPVRRLQPGSWAQVKLSGKKILGYALGKDEPLKDKYTLAGRSLFRVVTSEGMNEFLIDLNIEVEEFPF